MRIRTMLSVSRLAATFSALAAAALFLPATVTAAPAAAAAANGWLPCPTASPTNQVFPTNTTLYSGSRWCVAAYQLFMQKDGNLVIYDNVGNALWDSQTEGFPGAYAIIQNDGNFVIYSGTQWLWATNTGGHPYNYVCFQTDGNLVVYAPLPGTTACKTDALWWSGT